MPYYNRAVHRCSSLLVTHFNNMTATALLRAVDSTVLFMYFNRTVIRACWFNRFSHSLDIFGRVHAKKVIRLLERYAANNTTNETVKLWKIKQNSPGLKKFSQDSKNVFNQAGNWIYVISRYASHLNAKVSRFQTPAYICNVKVVKNINKTCIAPYKSDGNLLRVVILFQQYC